MNRDFVLVASLIFLAVVDRASAQHSRAQLSYETASVMRDACVELAKENNWQMAISIHDEAGRLITFAAMDNVMPALIEVSQWKGHAAAIFRTSTLETKSWDIPTVPNLAPVHGGVPFFTQDGQPLGGIGVSGHSGDSDIACAEAAIVAVDLVSAP